MSAKQHIEHLRLLARSKKKVSLLRKCPNTFIKALCECALNILKGNVPLSKRQKSRLSPYKKVVRELGKRSLPLYKKRRLLIQKGEGFLGFLIPAAVSALSTLINGAF